MTCIFYRLHLPYNTLSLIKKFCQYLMKNTQKVSKQASNIYQLKSPVSRYFLSLRFFTKNFNDFKFSSSTNTSPYASSYSRSYSSTYKSSYPRFYSSSCSSTYHEKIFSFFTNSIYFCVIDFTFVLVLDQVFLFSPSFLNAIRLF